MLNFVQKILAKITKRRIRRINRFTPCTPFENGGGVARKSSAAAAFGGGVWHCCFDPHVTKSLDIFNLSFITIDILTKLLYSSSSLTLNWFAVYLGKF